jgi:hypothetical protein
MFIHLPSFSQTNVCFAFDRDSFSLLWICLNLFLLFFYFCAMLEIHMRYTNQSLMPQKNEDQPDMRRQARHLHIHPSAQTIHRPALISSIPTNPDPDQTRPNQPITKTKPSPSSHPQYTSPSRGRPSRPSTPGSGATRRPTSNNQKRRAGREPWAGLVSWCWELWLVSALSLFGVALGILLLRRLRRHLLVVRHLLEVGGDWGVDRGC